jgi:DNA-binding CsgD family transcriptional regulator
VEFVVEAWLGVPDALEDVITELDAQSEVQALPNRDLAVLATWLGGESLSDLASRMRVSPMRVKADPGSRNAEDREPVAADAR